MRDGDVVAADRGACQRLIRKDRAVVALIWPSRVGAKNPSRCTTIVVDAQDCDFRELHCKTKPFSSGKLHKNGI